RHKPLLRRTVGALVRRGEPWRKEVGSKQLERSFAKTSAIVRHCQPKCCACLKSCKRRQSGGDNHLGSRKPREMRHLPESLGIDPAAPLKTGNRFLILAVNGSP